MLGTFILGIVAGWAAPMAEDALRPLLEKHLYSTTVPAGDLRAAALALCLLVAAIVAMILSSAHALPLAVGGLLGVLGPRLLDKARSMRTPDYDN